MNFFDSSAADAVTTLKVEPGTYSPAVARFRSGEAGRQSAVMLSMLPKPFSTRFGLKLGEDTIARTFPVRGSSATTAPHLVPSCSSATCCASRSRFSTTSFPLTGFPRSSSSALSRAVERFAFEEVR